MLPAIDVVRLSIAFSAPNQRSGEDLMDALRFLIPGIRLESGCLECSAWIEPDATVHYMEEWRNDAAMRRRVQSTGFTSLLSLLESSRAPRVKFDFIASTRGLDYVAEVRGTALQ